MRRAGIVAWLFAALGLAIYHFGPGQEQLKLDRIDAVLREARRHAAQGDPAAAAELYDQALSKLPSDRIPQQLKIRLEKAKAQMLAQQLPEAHDSLEGLLEDVLKHCPDDRELVADTRSTLASSRYYMTWLMRLEGLGRSEWEPEIEAARQHYRRLFEEAQKEGDTQAEQRHRQDLEAAIRLARMDLSELQGLPLPGQ